MKKIRLILMAVLIIGVIMIPTKALSYHKINNQLQSKSTNVTTLQIKPILNNVARNTIRVIELKQTEIKEQTEYFSETINIQVTKEIKEKINNQLEDLQTEAKMLAKLIYREARGIKPTADKAAVVWCVLNRVDNGDYGDSIKSVIVAEHQFAWVPKTPVKDEFLDLANDVLARWLLEKEGIENIGRILPKDYLFFAGRNGKNYFRQNYRSRSYWDWSLDSPYTD